MGLKLAIVPWFNHPDRGDGGIRRVVEAQVRYLRDYDVEPIENADEADVLMCHGTSLVTRPGKPVVNCNHGLYWSRYDWPLWGEETNALVIDAMANAQAHTVPSRWVGDAVRRGMLVYPEVIYHGVEYDEWQGEPGKHGGYVLWNKARTDAVSDPADMNQVAAMLPKRWFVSTFGNPARNVRLVGKQAHSVIKPLVVEAGGYLATTRETFGIGTLEAMAAGVPIAGWAWGGQLEIVRQGQTGYLAPPGDHRALADAIEACIAERTRLSANCKDDVQERWLWPDKIRQYAMLIHRVHEAYHRPGPRVSVIITCHNLARFVGEAIRSVQSQSFEDWECIVVDDASTDPTKEVVEIHCADPRVHYLPTPANLGLSAARNFGYRASRGRYVVFLDADDMMADNALAIQVEALDTRPGMHIVTGGLEIVDDGGKNRHRNDWPSGAYNWFGQMAHMNQIHYSSMMRREVMERSGGYRVRDWRAEDAALWCRVTSLGFRAVRVTDAPTLIYRDRSDSKSKGEPGDGPWTEAFGWALAYKFDRTLSVAAARGHHPNPDVVPFGAQGSPAPHKAWPVHDYANPFVSVIIPVGPGHERYVIDALDSLLAQRFVNWEAIVVNDTGRLWAQGFDSPLAGAPFARIITASQHLGPSGARNLGGKYARGEALLWLDADDYLMPLALDKMVAAYVESGRVIYTDVYQRFADDRKPMEPYVTEDFVCGAVLKRMQHTSQVLVPRAVHEKIGGFDTTAPGWEDWDYLIALQHQGLCSLRIPEPLFVYRKESGQVREKAWASREQNVKWIRNKWLPYYEGRMEMPCSKCPQPADGARKPQQVLSAASGGGSSGASTDAVLMAYQGPGPKRMAMRGKVTGTVYPFKQGEFRYVDARDATDFLGRVRGDGSHDFLLKPKPVLPSVPPPAEMTVAGPPLPLPVMGVDMAVGEDHGGIAEIHVRISDLDEAGAKALARTANPEDYEALIAEEESGKHRPKVLNSLKYWQRMRGERATA